MTPTVRQARLDDEESVVAFAEAVWETVDTDGLALSVEGDATLSADPGRLRSLFAAAFRFAAHNGDPIGDSSPEAYFEYGGAISDAEAGLDLPNLRMLAETHGWNVTLDAAYRDGISIAVAAVST